MNFLVDYIPNDIKRLIYDECNLLNKLILYLYLKVNDKYFNANILRSDFNRYLNKEEIKELIKMNNIKLFLDILHISSDKFYLDELLKIDESILVKACKYGSNNIINWYLENDDKSFSKSINETIQKKCCYNCIKYNHIECLKIIKDKNFQWGSDIFLACSKSNNLDMFKLMIKSELDINESLINDSHDIYSVALNDKCFVNSLFINKHLDKIYESICYNCNILFLEYLYDIYPIVKYSHLVNCINKKSSFEDQKRVIEWSLYKMLPMSVEYCNKAALIGNVELLKWLRYKGFPWEEKIIKSACLGGNYELLIYIKDNWMFSQYTDLIEYATLSGNYEMVKCLYDINYKISIRSINNSIIINNVKIFNFLINNNMQSNVNDIINNSNMFNFIINNMKSGTGYNFETELLTNIIKSPNNYYFLYLYKNGYYSKHYNTQKIIELAIEFNKIYILDIIHPLYNIETFTINHTINDCNYDVFLWYYEKTRIILNNDIVQIINNENLKLLEWCVLVGYDKQIIKEHIIKNDKISLLDYIKDSLVIEDSVTATKFGSLKFLIYLHEINKLDKGLGRLAINYGKKEIYSWLKSINYFEIEEMECTSGFGLIFNYIKK